MSPDTHDTAEHSGHTRRGVLALVGTTGVIALAGCADGGDEPTEEEPAATEPGDGGAGDETETETESDMGGDETETESDMGGDTETESDVGSRNPRRSVR